MTLERLAEIRAKHAATVEIGIAGFTERYHLLPDGRTEIEFSDGVRVLQLPSQWDDVNAWQHEAGRHRSLLAKARAVIEGFEERARRNEIIALLDHIDALTRERDEAVKNAYRWELFADTATREVSSNGDNSFVRYVGPWVVAEYKHDPEDGDYLLPSNPYEWIDSEDGTPT